MDSTYCKNGGTNQKATSRRDRLALTEDEPVRRTMRGTATNTYAEGPFGLNLWILHFMVLILALTSLYLSWHYIYRMGVMYMHVRANKSKTFLRKATINKDGKFEESEYNTPWEELSLTEKFKFFNISMVVIIVGNCAQILGSCVALCELFVPSDLLDFKMFNVKIALIGFGCMCSWLMIIYYLDYNKNFQSTTKIIKSSSVGFIKFLVGVLPVYMAFVFLGRCLFWKYSKFETTNQAIIALFAIIAGDIVDETYTDTSGEGLVSGIYLTAFIILFMGAVHNVIISIVSDGFRNKFLEERYQKLFSLYALGQGPSGEMVEKGYIPELDEKEKEEKKDPLASLIPFLGGKIEVALDDRFREKMELIETERNRILHLLHDKTHEIEGLLERMKEIVNYFVEEAQSKEAKKKVKGAYVKYLLTINYYIKKEIKEKLQKAEEDQKIELGSALKPQKLNDEEEERKSLGH